MSSVQDHMSVSIDNLPGGGSTITIQEKPMLLAPLEESLCKHFDDRIFKMLLDYALSCKNYEELNNHTEQIFPQNSSSNRVVLDYIVAYLIRLNVEWDDNEFESCSFLCINCFLRLLPLLNKLFQWILKLHTWIKEINTFGQQKMLWYQFLFVQSLVSRPFVMEYIMQHKCIYQLFFRYCVTIYKWAFVDASQWHLWMEKNPPTLIENQFPFAANVRGAFNVGFFFESVVFWNADHIQYLLSLGVEDLWSHKLIEKMGTEYLSVYGSRKYKYYLKRDTLPLFTMKFCQLGYVINAISFFIVMSHILKYTKRDYILRRWIYLLTGKGAENLQCKKIVFNSNIHNVMEMCRGGRSKKNCLYEMFGYWKNFNSLIDINDNTYCYRRMISRYKRQHKRRSKCMNYKCGSYQCVVSGSDLSNEKKTLIKTKFWTCSGCKIAVYCSRTCQKYHWNTYHRFQCKTLITI